MTPETPIGRALDLARIAHEGQEYRPGEPYFDIHVRTVAARCVRFGDEAVVVALLHDTVEDTPVTLDEIAAAFGKRIADCVDLCTDPPGKNRRERKAEAHRRLERAVAPHLSPGIVAKVADRLCNVAASVKHGDRRLEMYRREHAAFRASAFRPGLCDDLWEELEALLEPPGPLTTWLTDAEADTVCERYGLSRLTAG